MRIVPAPLTRMLRSVTSRSVWPNNMQTTTSRIDRTLLLSFSSSSSSQEDKNGGSSTLLPNDGLTLSDFVQPRASAWHNDNNNEWTDQRSFANNNNDNSPHATTITFHIKTYGCQMNVNDTDIVRRVLLNAQAFVEIQDERSADIVLTNTCAIRKGAEQKIWNRIHTFKKQNTKQKKKKKQQLIGILGCMAERLQEKLLPHVDLVVGPDAYRDLPNVIHALLSSRHQQQQQEKDPRKQKDKEILEPQTTTTRMNVQLSKTETYHDIFPASPKDDNDNNKFFVSIQRGCSNRCSFCIVPFTRGVERSRPMQSILDEVQRLVHEQGAREVTLLGQNVNSYHDRSPQALSQCAASSYTLSNAGFRSRMSRPDGGYFFGDLLEAVADLHPHHLRVRFTSPHPKDYPVELLTLMAERPNICNSLHMPAQSGSSSVLKRMKRGYTREAYLELLDTVQTIIPDVSISSDFIAGFCGETEEEHADTVSLLETVRFDQAYMFAYSLREQTHAARTMSDNVAPEVKQRRLAEIIDTFQHHVHEKNKSEVGKLRLALIEGKSKRSQPGKIKWRGRTDQNKVVVFDVPSDDTIIACPSENDVQALRPFRENNNNTPPRHNARLQVGDYAVVQVTEAKGPGLRGRLLWKSDSITSFHDLMTRTTKAEEGEDHHQSPDAVNRFCQLLDASAA